MFSNLNLTDEQIKGIEKVFQSESDKIRTEYTKKIKDLEQFKPKEKSKEEIELEERIKNLEIREKELLEKEKAENISNQLKSKGLPEQLGKYFVGVDDVETSINEFEEIFKVSKLDNSFTPNIKNIESKATLNKEEFKNMGYVERVKLLETNPDLYKSLSE